MLRGYWFNSRQNAEEVLQKGFFMPKTHFWFQIPTNTECVTKATVSAFYGETLAFEKDYVLEKPQPEGFITLTQTAETLKADPDRLGVKVVCGESVFEESIPCSYVEISGMTTDFDGQPLPAAVVFNYDSFGGMERGMGVWSDVHGFYKIRLPKGEYNSIFVDDHTYGSETLEAWGWKMIVDRDEVHDFKIGNGEVYSLDAWANNGGDASLFIYFRPMVLSFALMAKQLEQQEERPMVAIGGRKFVHVPLSPDITDASAQINGKKLEKISLQKIYETSAGGVAMPAYILQCVRPFGTGKQTLIVEYDFTDADGQPARGQGRTQFHYTSPFGLALR